MCFTVQLASAVYAGRHIRHPASPTQPLKPIAEHIERHHVQMARQGLSKRPAHRRWTADAIGTSFHV